MNFADRLNNTIQQKKTPLVVGLDPRAERLPKSFAVDTTHDPQDLASIYEQFCKEIIDVVSPLVPAVKPQAAFFENLGPSGMSALWQVVRYAQSKGLLVIMDAKRGDIGSTAEAYATAFLGNESDSAWGCDALTVNPYLGDDSLEPFTNRCIETGSGIFVLVRTSNPGGKMLQELVASEQKIYSIVADHVQGLAKQTIGQTGYGCVGAVVGATNPQQLAILRKQMPNTIFLVPGIGAQGGTARDVAAAFDDAGLGAVINSSRAIIFAYENEKYSSAQGWQDSVQKSTVDTIEAIADATAAGNLN